jgi:hypothetical protein
MGMDELYLDDFGKKLVDLLQVACGDHGRVFADELLEELDVNGEGLGTEGGAFGLKFFDDPLNEEAGVIFSCDDDCFVGVLAGLLIGIGSEKQEFGVDI